MARRMSQIYLDLPENKLGEPHFWEIFPRRVVNVIEIVGGPVSVRHMYGERFKDLGLGSLDEEVSRIAPEGANAYWALTNFRGSESGVGIERTVLFYKIETH
jgi:hypothetical protein